MITIHDCAQNSQGQIGVSSMAGQVFFRLLPLPGSVCRCDAKEGR